MRETDEEPNFCVTICKKDDNSGGLSFHFFGLQNAQNFVLAAKRSREGNSLAVRVLENRLVTERRWVEIGSDA
jgi:hypothetical protein